MSRISWLALGAVSGVYAVTKVKRTVRNFTPDGMAARAAAWRTVLRAFTAEVAAGMAQREAELRRQLELEPRAIEGARAPQPPAAVELQP